MSGHLLTTAAEIAAREGHQWRCRCPIHGGRSLLVRDGDAGTNASLMQALALINEGLPCFPCHADKKPATPRGFKDATSDRNVAHELWTCIDQIGRRRAQLLTAVLTIWRWGRQNATVLTRGKPLGSFESWAEWCRDPFVALGCRDPVERIEALKANDPRRQRVGELFRAWWEHHGAMPIKASDLAEPVKAIADPQGARTPISRDLSIRARRHARCGVRAHAPGAGRKMDCGHLRTQQDCACGPHGA